MRFYAQQQHKHYCGIDLPARSVYICIIDQAGTILVHKNMPATPEAFLRIVAPYRDDWVVAVKCIFRGIKRAPFLNKRAGLAAVHRNGGSGNPTGPL